MKLNLIIVSKCATGVLFTLQVLLIQTESLYKLSVGPIDYLGMKIDENISWTAQTDSLCKKLVFIVSRLSRLRKVLPPNMLAYI